MFDTSGRQVGTVSLAEDRSGILVRVNAEGLSAGPRGLHVHTVGRCEGPSFASAGPHWNPTGRKHGRESPQGAHVGDLANVVIQQHRRGSSAFLIGGARFLEGPNPLIDLDGAAVVLHARADDYKTDPDGASGQRIACAVFNF